MGLSLSVKGNLRDNIEFWKSVGAPYFILSIIIDEKSVWEPTQILDWLGLTFDLEFDLGHFKNC